MKRVEEERGKKIRGGEGEELGEVSMNMRESIGGGGRGIREKRK